MSGTTHSDIQASHALFSRQAFRFRHSLGSRARQHNRVVVSYRVREIPNLIVVVVFNCCIEIPRG